MNTQVRKCPGGVTLVVPDSLAALAGLTDGGSAEVEMTGGQLVVRPTGPGTLAALLAGITSENLHGEWADGSPAGGELL